MIISHDGTSLVVTSVGAGPGLVVVHGSMQTGSSQRELAELLAETHTVHLLDRRGRNGSSPAGSTATEVDDLRAVLRATGADSVLGISTGALIAARAALVEPGIRRLALFEPPLPIGASVRLDLLPRFTATLEADDLPRAMGLAMKLAEMGPPWMFGLPLSALAAVSRRMLAKDPGLRELVLALRADFTVVRENADRVDDFSGITVPTLLLDGTRTRPYLRGAVDALARVIPNSTRVRLPGLTHGATQDRAQWGRPDLVAPVIAEFLA